MKMDYAQRAINRPIEYNINEIRRVIRNCSGHVFGLIDDRKRGVDDVVAVARTLILGDIPVGSRWDLRPRAAGEDGLLVMVIFELKAHPVKVMVGDVVTEMEVLVSWDAFFRL
jgi:hypothetical protein